MNRRNLLKNIALISGGALVLPHCSPETADEQQVVSELSEKILPGAVALGTPAFITRMVNDCFSKENQEKFKKGLKIYARSQPGDLTSLDSKKDEGEEKFFYATVKNLTIQFYTNSKQYLTTIQKYELVPGRYHGCVPVNAETKRSL